MYYEILDEDLDISNTRDTESAVLKEKFADASKICECIFNSKNAITVELTDH